MVEQLRAESNQALHPAAAAQVTPAENDRGYVELTEEIQRVSEAHRAAQQQTAESERELQALQQQAQSMKRECTQLREKLLQDKEAQQAAQAKMEERGEALVAGLQSDELRLEGTVREVEELRARVLKRGGLEKQQVDRVEQLRRSIAETRAVTLHHTVRCRELRSRLDGANTVADNAAATPGTAVPAIS